MTRPRSALPGLERRVRGNTAALYWVASRAAVKAGYPVRTVRLYHPDGSPQLAARCEALQAELDDWVAGDGEPLTDSERHARALLAAYDGRIKGLATLYTDHPDSPFQERPPNTQRSYLDDIRLIVRTVGERRLARLNGLDFRRWYKNFRKPATTDAPERVRRAHGAMGMLRMLFSFGMTLDLAECARLRGILGEMRFEDAAPRDVQVTLEQTVAFIAKAHKLGWPEMALAQALQFESTLRQWDVIGEWHRDPATGGMRWTKGLLWNDIGRDRILTKKTSKTTASVAIDLNQYPLVTVELDGVGEARIGPVIVDHETGEPFKRRKFSGLWREIARAAAIPDHVWNRDSRAGSITEALDAGAELDDTRQHAGHTESRTTQRYNRDTLAKTRRVARIRVAARRPENDA